MKNIQWTVYRDEDATTNNKKDTDDINCTEMFFNIE